MWEFDRYDWKSFHAYRQTSKVPEMLMAVLNSKSETEWSTALSYLEACASDLGVPCAMTPALVSALVSVTLRVEGKKRTDVLSLLEELTCGRGREEYSDAQRKWLHEAVQELVFALKVFADIMERSSAEDAERCVDLLAYCAEQVPTLTSRVRKYLALCQGRFPELSNEIQAVSEYFGADQTVDPGR